MADAEGQALGQEGHSAVLFKRDPHPDYVTGATLEPAAHGLAADCQPMQARGEQTATRAADRLVGRLLLEVGKLLLDELPQLLALIGRGPKLGHPMGTLAEQAGLAYAGSQRATIFWSAPWRRGARSARARRAAGR